MCQFSFGSSVDLYVILVGNFPSLSACFVYERCRLHNLTKVDHIDTAQTHEGERRKQRALAAVVRHEAINLIVLPTEQYFIFIESNVRPEPKLTQKIIKEFALCEACKAAEWAKKSAKQNRKRYILQSRHDNESKTKHGWKWKCGQQQQQPPTSTNTRSATKRYFNGNDFACKLEISFVRLYYLDEKWVTWPYKAVYLCAVWK